MNTFRQDNMRNIQQIFETQTGVTLPQNSAPRHSVRTAFLTAAVLALCLCATAYAYREFTSLDGDELSLEAVYEGGGVISVVVENSSDKTLCFQNGLKLKRWATGEELVPLSENIELSGAEFPPHSKGMMTIDLSNAYDIAALEQPVEDWYYLVLTNNNFIFGQDWMCAINFAEPLAAKTEPFVVSGISEAELSQVEKTLRPYFEQIDLTPDTRRVLNAEYAKQVEELLAEYDGMVVPSVSPALQPQEPDENAVFDPIFTTEPQRVLTGLHSQPMDWNFKLLATETEYAQVLSVMMPLKGYRDTFRDMPIYYFFTYEKSVIDENKYAFIYGQLLSFAELNKYKVWEDDTYVCYEVHKLIYTDLGNHTQEWLKYNADVFFDDTVWQRVQNVYSYYQGNMSFHNMNDSD